MKNFILWYFGDAVKFLVNFLFKTLKFIVYFFALSFHLRHFFAPWKKMMVGYGRGFRLEVFFSSLALNSASRIIGAFLRILIIIWTVLLFILVLFLGLIIILLWLFLPVIIIYLIISAFYRG